MQRLQADQILFEDNHLLVVDKPAGIATMGSKPGVPTLARMAADFLKRKYQKPGNAYVGVVSRLDRQVSGLIVLAKTSKAAGRLSEQIRNRQVSKRYVAWVEGEWPEAKHEPTMRSDVRNWEKRSLTGEEGWVEVVNWVIKNDRQHRMEIATPRQPNAQQAVLRRRVLGSGSGSALVEVDLLTGRKHQIRLQLSDLGHPVIGDYQYGATRKFAPGIALHCCQLVFDHPTQRVPMHFVRWPDSRWAGLPMALQHLLGNN